MTDQHAALIADMFVALRNEEDRIPIAHEWRIRMGGLPLIDQDRIFDWLPIWCQREIAPERFEGAA